MAGRITRLDDCPFLLSSQINDTLAYFADHSQGFSHEMINRYLRQDKMTPGLLWDKIKDDLVPSANGFIVFDDTVLDKNYAHGMELVRRTWSGKAKTVIKGIGVVTCVYVNPELDRFWAIDYRLYAPQDDGKTKLAHVQEMLLNLGYHKTLPFTTALMESWYATRSVTQAIEALSKIYYGLLKANRRGDDTDGQQAHRRVESLSGSDLEQQQSKRVHVKDFPKGHRLKWFRLVLSTQRTDYVITHDLTQNFVDAVQKVCAIR